MSTQTGCSSYIHNSFLSLYKHLNVNQDITDVTPFDFTRSPKIVQSLAKMATATQKRHLKPKTTLKSTSCILLCLCNKSQPFVRFLVFSKTPFTLH